MTLNYGRSRSAGRARECA